MRYTNHFRDCHQALTAATEYNADIILVLMARLQRIVEEIRTSYLDNSSSLRGPVVMYVKSFKDALQRYKSELPQSLQQNSEYHQTYYMCVCMLTSDIFKRRSFCITTL